MANSGYQHSSRFQFSSSFNFFSTTLSDRHAGNLKTKTQQQSVRECCKNAKYKTRDNDNKRSSSAVETKFQFLWHSLVLLSPHKHKPVDLFRKNKAVENIVYVFQPLFGKKELYLILIAMPVP